MAELGWNWIDLAQLLLAVVLGCLIGYLRELSQKPAGITTITLVTLTSTLIMQLSYKLPGTDGTIGDPARLAAAVITGIGFLGAGVILRHGTHVQGITTAATVWLMAGVGLAVGAGYYIPAVTVVILAWIGFLIDPYTERFIESRRKRLSDKRLNDPQNRD